jgi:hypothetical protein
MSAYLVTKGHLREHGTLSASKAAIDSLGVSNLFGNVDNVRSLVHRERPVQQV